MYFIVRKPSRKLWRYREMNGIKGFNTNEHLLTGARRWICAVKRLRVELISKCVRGRAGLSIRVRISGHCIQ